MIKKMIGVKEVDKKVDKEVDKRINKECLKVFQCLVILAVVVVATITENKLWL